MLPIFDEYIDYLRSLNRTVDHHKVSFRFFCRYLEDSSLSWESFSTKEAQQLQTTLMGLTDSHVGQVYKPSSVAHLICSLKGFYSWARRKKLVAENPIILVQGIKQRRAIPSGIYDQESLDKLLKWLVAFNDEATVIDRRERYVTHLVAELLYATGEPIGSIANLKLSELDLVEGLVHFPNRVAFLTHYAIQVLGLFVHTMRDTYLSKANYHTTRELLFGARGLGKIVNRVLTHGCRELGLALCTTKMFRQALCLHLVNAECDARFIQILVGHQCLSSTQHYVSLDFKHLRGVLDDFHPRSRIGNPSKQEQS